MPSIEDLVIGESRDELEVSGVEEHRQVVFHMLRQATRTVDIVSRHLDRRLFDQRDLIDVFASTGDPQQTRSNPSFSRGYGATDGHVVSIDW